MKAAFILYLEPITDVLFHISNYFGFNLAQRRHDEMKYDAFSREKNIVFYFYFWWVSDCMRLCIWFDGKKMKKIQREKNSQVIPHIVSTVSCLPDSSEEKKV